MKKILIGLYVIFPLVLLSQSNITKGYYSVTAENGLNVRSEPQLSSKRIAKLPFGLIVEKISDTNSQLTIEDNGTQLKGHWVKIIYSNYPYQVSEDTDPFKREGYVFDGYLKKMKLENFMTIIKIDKSKFDNWLKAAVKYVNKPKSIHNRDSIKTILKERVEWFTEDDRENGIQEGDIKSITIANGQKLIINQSSSDFYLTEEEARYYPEYDILSLEKGHMGSMNFSLQTGETAVTVGAPECMIPSPQTPIV